MKKKIYIVYYEDKVEKIFLKKKKAEEYKELLLLNAFEDLDISVEMRYLYV